MIKQPILYKLITSWILLLVLFACTQEEESILAPQGSGSLTLTIASTPASRAETPGDGNLAGGGGMEDLTLVLVNPVGRISEISQLSGLTGAEQTIKTVTFSNLDVGNYTIYAYANTQRAQLSEARTLLANLTKGGSFTTATRDALFSAMSGTTTPRIHTSEPLLLTAFKEVEVGIGNSSEQIDLLRPVVWFEVRLFNHSEQEMQIQEISFSNFNPSTGYLLPHGGTIPSAATYRSLPSLEEYTNGTDMVVAPNTEQTIYETALFENRASSYTMSLQIGVGGAMWTDAVAISTKKAYALCNRSTGNYLVDNGNGRLAVVDALEEARSQEHALWSFSGESSGYITNVATGNRFFRSTSAASSGSSLTFAWSSGYLRLYYRSGRSYYYLRDNGGSVSYSRTDDYSGYWRLRELTAQSASLTDSQIKVVDPVTAAVTPMSEQLRNQHIIVSINAYYNDTDGSFNFKVTPWVEKNEEVEFN